MARRQPKPFKEFGRYGSVGIELVLSIMLGLFGGQWADERWGGGHGWLTALGAIVGTYAGFRALFVAASHMQKDVERAERRDRGEDPWQNDPPAPTSSADAEPRDGRKHDDDDPRR
jgi:hypothetical protein